MFLFRMKECSRLVSSFHSSYFPLNGNLLHMFFTCVYRIKHFIITYCGLYLIIHLYILYHDVMKYVYDIINVFTNCTREVMYVLVDASRVTCLYFWSVSLAEILNKE